MFPLQNIRMNSLFGARPQAPQPNTNYPILNDFFTKILPLLKQGELAERNRGRINSTQNQMFPRQLPMQQPQDNEVIDLTGAMPKMQPVSTQWGGMSPYQEALIKLREQELGLNREKLASTTDINQQKVDIARFKSENPSARIVDNKQGKLLAINPITGEVVGEWDSGSMSEEEKVRLTQAGALDRIAATGRERITQIDRQGEIQRRLQELRGQQTIEAIRERAELEKELIGVRADKTMEINEAKPVKELPPSQQRIKTLENARRAYNEHPEWQKYIIIDGNSFVVKPSGDPKVDESIKNAIYNKTDIALKEPKEETKPEPKKDPLGIRK